jgi:hypothetical protein
MSDEDSVKASPDAEKPPSDESAKPAAESPQEESTAASAAPAGEAAPDAPADGELKSTKRKKKRKKRADEPSAPEAEPLNAEGRERPLFVLAFPKDPTLDKLARAFELGNYAYVREHAPSLAEKAEDPRVRDAARELSRRIEPDPLIKILLGLSVALLVALTVWAYKSHGL